MKEEHDAIRLTRRYKELVGHDASWDTVEKHYKHHRTQYERFYVCPHCNAYRLIVKVEAKAEGTYTW